MKTVTVFVVSGGTGASGEQLVRTVLVQFPDSQVRVITESHVHHAKQIEETVTEAAKREGTIVHTLVDPALRQALVDTARRHHVVEIDLMGPLMRQLTTVLGQEPIAHPGRYRRLRRAYFDRVGAIEFSIAHDDGQRPEGWSQADIVLVGPSRVGKTPLSMYLAVLGWRVANVPLVPDLPVPQALLSLDRRRVFGLSMEAGQLAFYRRERQQRMGGRTLGAYADPHRIHEEIEAARAVCRRHGFSVLDVTDRPIEASADEVVDLLTRRLGSKAHQSTGPNETQGR
jgi:regulator of PEP synthase PpsR (kinase-PPPase family)